MYKEFTKITDLKTTENTKFLLGIMQNIIFFKRVIDLNCKLIKSVV